MPNFFNLVQKLSTVLIGHGFPKKFAEDTWGATKGGEKAMFDKIEEEKKAAEAEEAKKLEAEAKEKEGEEEPEEEEDEYEAPEETKDEL